MKILLVDDNPRIRALIMAILTDSRIEFRECGDGESAVGICKSWLPDLVLMDVYMGGIDGLEATRRIMRETPGIKIVIVTLYDDPCLRTAAVEAGAAGYVLKDSLLSLRAICSPVS